MRHIVIIILSPRTRVPALPTPIAPKKRSAVGSLHFWLDAEQHPVRKAQSVLGGGLLSRTSQPLICITEHGLQNYIDIFSREL